MLTEINSLSTHLVEIAGEAGALLQHAMPSLSEYSVTLKVDNTPVTDLDKKINDFLVAQLERLTPGVAILAEEDKQHSLLPLDEFWCVDPIDGTKGLLAGEQDYCINIALIQHGLPVLALIHAPVTGITYLADAVATVVLQNEKSTLLKVATGRSFDQMRLLTGVFNRIDDVIVKYVPSWLAAVDHMNSALKFCAIARGDADIYVRIGPTSLWDAAAGQLIVEQAGGCVVDFSGEKLQYRPEHGLINAPFIVLGSPEHLPAVLTLCQTIRGHYDDDKKG